MLWFCKVDSGVVSTFFFDSSSLGKGTNRKKLNETLSKERMTEGGKCAKKYINASVFNDIFDWEKWSFRARSHSHTNPISNRIENWEEAKKKIQLENLCEANSVVSCIEWYSRLCRECQSARAHTTSIQCSISFVRCVWIERVCDI